MIDQKLKTLLSVVREGSYTRAADMLSLSQPAVSYHIRQLEEDNEIKIFYHNRKKLTLTPEGEVLVKYAKRLESISENARRALLDTKQNLRHFTVGITPTCGETLVARVFTSYCEAHPHTNISIATDTLDQLCDRTIAVTAPLELRVRRIMARDNITEQYARLRISAQQPDEYYRGKCDCELNNAADTAAAFEMEAREFFQRLIDTIKEEKAHGKQGI